MNTIPLTFNEHQISVTIIGGKEKPAPNAMNITVVLLNKTGSQFKQKIFDELIGCNFSSIISMEPAIGNYNIEEVSRRYPGVKFILPHEEVSEGELINIAMTEIKTEYAFVIKDSLYIPSGIILPNLAEKLISMNSICVAPRLVDMKKGSLPIYKVPSSSKSRFVLDARTQIQDGLTTVFPFDFIGLYNREKFISIGGFDYSIKAPYWQLLDFGIRSWLWGERIQITTTLQLSYNVAEPPLEDTTPSLDSLRFYLKNELPRFRMDSAFIKSSSFWRFFVHSGCGYMEAKRQFKDAQNWVDMNKYRFKMDLQGLIENWK